MNNISIDQAIDQDILTKYQILTKLGSGAYGHVWKVMDKNDKKQYALKKVYSAFQNQLDAERTFRQISILKKLDHQNIVQLKKVYRAKNDFDLYLVFELVQSDLFKAVKGNFLNEIHRKYVVYQIAKSLKYLHSAGILHRDIKPSNILIDIQCKIKICDFGLSRTSFSYSSEQTVVTEFIATRWYRAPQVMLGSQSYTTKADIWSFGCLIYQMYVQKALMPGKDNADQIQKLLQFKGFPSEQQKNSLKVNEIDKILGYFSLQKKQSGQYFSKIQDKKLKKLLLRIFQYDPEKRPSAQQILKSSFLQQFINYQNEPVMQTKIQLQQNENIKLTAEQYKQLIYDNFVQKQSHNQRQSHGVRQSLENQRYDLIPSQKRSIISRNLKQKSTDSIGKAKEVILQPYVKDEQYKIVQKNNTIIQNQNLQRKKESVSMHAPEKGQKQGSVHKRHKKQHSEQSSLKNPGYATNQIKSSMKFKKRTIQRNSIHYYQNKQNQFMKQQQECMQGKRQCYFGVQKKMVYSLTNSPQKYNQKDKKSHQCKTLVKSKQKRSIDVQHSLIIQKQLEPHQPPQKHSSSLHSRNTGSLGKLPQLITNKKSSIILQKKVKQYTKIFNQITNNNNKIQSQLISELKQNKFTVKNKFHDGKKLQKKGITHLYNKCD